MEFTPQTDVMVLVKTVPTYAQAYALQLLVKQPREFAKMIL
jgi:hypothetical protein